MKLDKIHLVFTLDSNFIQHCSVTLASIFITNTSEMFHVHIIYDDRGNRELKRLEKFIQRQGHFVDMHFFNNEITRSFKVSQHVSHATYYRIFIPALLKNESRAIYIDCDIIVEGGIRDLWNFNLEENIIGAVKNYGETYFNAGVLLIDLDRWRNASVTEKSVNWINENNEAIQFWDQDALNAVLGKSVAYMPEKWNFMRTNSTLAFIHDQDIKIIHFAGSHKPWNFYCEHSLKLLYFKYLVHTPWKNFKMSEEKFFYKTKQKIKEFLGVNKK